jgi:farnesol dehydrogenase
MSVFVTGATGFIGNHLVEQLVQKGELVHVFCRQTAYQTSPDNRNIKVFRGDIRNPESVENAMMGCDRVFHLAAYARNWAKDPKTFYDVNVGGLKNVLDAALKNSIRKVVFTSSSLTIGPSNGSSVNETDGRTAGFFTEYERSKCTAEEEVQEYVKRGLQVVTVNPTRVFGPGLLNEGNSVTKLIQMYINGQWRVILGDGKAIGNYVYVHDVVQGHLHAMERGRAGEKYILGGENVHFNDFLNILSELSNRKYRLFHVPPFLAIAVSEIEKVRALWSDHYPLITPGWVKLFLEDWGYSCVKAQSELGYIITPLREAMEITIGWLERTKNSEKTH